MTSKVTLSVAVAAVAATTASIGPHAVTVGASNKLMRSSAHPYQTVLKGPSARCIQGTDGHLVQLMFCNVATLASIGSYKV